MPVIYKPRQSSIANKEGKKMYHPSVVLTGSVDTDRIAEEIAELSSLSKGDTKNVIENLITVTRRHLQASESVSLDGFGSFRYTMKNTKGGVDNAADVSATQSQLMVRFRPAATKNLDGSVATRSLVTGARCVRIDQVETDDNNDDDGQTGGGDGGGSEEGGDGGMD